MGFFCFPILSLLAGSVQGVTNSNASQLQIVSTCNDIAAHISSASEVFYEDHPLYYGTINHWASSSSQRPTCVFEPGSPEDIGIALQIIGQTRTPFAVKGGGHATNPGFSSTHGVHISMSRFSDVVYDASSQAAMVGSGMFWDDVYADLEPYGVTVVGGRVSGVGVAGFTLGGGYSWLTEQYGLAIDNVQAFELVTPSGTIINVTKSSNPDLFFGLKGGFNNFGVVTRFTLQTHPQSLVWGGTMIVDADGIDRLAEATQTFIETNEDPKAAIMSTYSFLLGSQLAFCLLFYDSPEPPNGLFDDFLAIEAYQDVSTRNYLSLVQSSPMAASSGKRGAFHTVTIVDYSRSFHQAVINETRYWATQSGLDPYFFSCAVEPFKFLRTQYQKAGVYAESAYPTAQLRATGAHPILMYASWEDPAKDEAMHNALRTMADTLRAKSESISEHGDNDETFSYGSALLVQHSEYREANVFTNASDSAIAPPLYGNYALAGTPLEDIYGDNLPRLRKIKRDVDPDNVMGLAGGWKF